MNTYRKLSALYRASRLRMRTTSSLRLYRLTPALLSAVFVLSGCWGGTEPTRYYVNPSADLSAIGRVAIVELNNESAYPQIGPDVMESLYQAVQKKQLFGLIRVKKTDPAWRSLQLEVDAKYSLEQLSAIHRTLKCNAVVIGTITEYQPYPHLTLGLRLRLINLDSAELLWALEQVWDTSDKTIDKRIRDYFNAQIRPGYEPLRQELVILSSLKFVKFVAYEVAETLEPIN